MKNWIIIFLLFPYPVICQNYFESHFGGSVGIAINFGSHQTSLGFTFNAFWTDYFVQINANTTANYHFYGLGERKKYWEMRNAAGVILLAGKKERILDFQLDGLNHQTNYNYGIGFNYISYKDQVGTSQLSGGFAAHIKQLSIYHENDVFGGQARDRFRTGQFHFSYQYEDYKFGFGLKMWTGETRNGKFVDVSTNKIRGGYKILEALPYGKTSHGILYGSFSYNLPYKQDLFLKLGIDSEQIRHGFQNRLIHDLLFLPENVKHNSPHYPRLDKNGSPVFDSDSVRPAKLYFQFGLTEGWYN